MPTEELTVTAATVQQNHPIIPPGFRSVASKQPKHDLPVVVITATRAVVIATYGRIDVPGFPFVVAHGFTIAGGAPVDAVAWRNIPKNWR